MPPKLVWADDAGTRLLARGARADVQDAAGKTPLELAVENGKTRVAAVLRSASAP